MAFAASRWNSGSLPELPYGFPYRWQSAAAQIVRASRTYYDRRVDSTSSEASLAYEWSETAVQARSENVLPDLEQMTVAERKRLERCLISCTTAVACAEDTRGFRASHLKQPLRHSTPTAWSALNQRTLADQTCEADRRAFEAKRFAGRRPASLVSVREKRADDWRRGEFSLRPVLDQRRLAIGGHWVQPEESVCLWTNSRMTSDERILILPRDSLRSVVQQDGQSAAHWTAAASQSAASRIQQGDFGGNRRNVAGMSLLRKSGSRARNLTWSSRTVGAQLAPIRFSHRPGVQVGLSFLIGPRKSLFWIVPDRGRWGF